MPPASAISAIVTIRPPSEMSCTALTVPATTSARSASIAASVPLSEMFGYSTKLRSSSQGRAVYSMEFSQYGETPKTVAEEIIAKGRGGA